MFCCISSASALWSSIQSAISFNVSNASGAFATTAAIVFNTEPSVEASPFKVSIASSTSETRPSNAVTAARTVAAELKLGPSKLLV
jgi:hypothetical protein